MNIFKEFYELEQSDGWDDLFDYIKYESNYNYSFKVAQLPQNRERNRYNNVLPYDHNRIRLYPHVYNSISPNGTNTFNIQKSQSFAGNLNAITTNINFKSNNNNISGYHSSYQGGIASGGTSHPPRNSVMPTKTIRSRWFRKSNTTNSNAPNAANAKFKFSYRSNNTSAKNPFSTLIHASHNNNNTTSSKTFNNSSFNDYINASLLPLTVPRYDPSMVYKSNVGTDNAINLQHNNSDPFKKTTQGHFNPSIDKIINSNNNAKDLFLNFNNTDGNTNIYNNKTVTYQYILTQGPLSNTAGHFWAMAWHHKVRCVIMLNKIYEMGSLKCHPYFPGAPTSPFSDEGSGRYRHKFGTHSSAQAHSYASSTNSNASEDDQSATSFEHIDNDTSSSNSHSDVDVNPSNSKPVNLPNNPKNLGLSSKPINDRVSGKKHVSNAKSSKRIMDLCQLTMDLPDVGLSISTLQRDINPDYTITLYELKDTKSGQTRPIYHFQYTAWPDFGVPTDPNSFLAFLARIHSVAYNNNKNHMPAVNHLTASIPSSTINDKNEPLLESNLSTPKTQEPDFKMADPIKMTINDLSSDACDMPDNILVRTPPNIESAPILASPTTSSLDKDVNLSPTLEDDLTPTGVLADESFSKFTTTATRPSSCTSVYSQSYPIINNDSINNNLICNNTNNSAPSPIIVHCSAGIGRSGTYCLIDYVLNLLNINDFNKNHSAATTQPSKSDTYPCNFPTLSSKNALLFTSEQIMNDKTIPPNLRQTIELPALLCGMRRYRAGLVQTPDQLRFAYLTILTAIHNHLQMSSSSSANPNAAGHVRPNEKEYTLAEYKTRMDERFKVDENGEERRNQNYMEYTPPLEQLITPKEGFPCTTSPLPTSTYPPSASPYFVTYSPKTVSPNNPIYLGTNRMDNNGLQNLDPVSTSDGTSQTFLASSVPFVDTKIANSNNFTFEKTFVCSVSSPINSKCQLERMYTPESHKIFSNAVAMPSSQSLDRSTNPVIENVNIANNNNNNKTCINSNNIHYSNILPGPANASNIVYKEGQQKKKKDNDGDDEELIFHMETTL